MWGASLVRMSGSLDLDPLWIIWRRAPSSRPGRFDTSSVEEASSVNGRRCRCCAVSCSHDPPGKRHHPDQVTAEQNSRAAQTGTPRESAVGAKRLRGPGRTTRRARSGAHEGAGVVRRPGLLLARYVPITPETRLGDQLAVLVHDLALGDGERAAADAGLLWEARQ